MCFIVDENNTEILIANKDIICYKYTYNEYIGKNGFLSMFTTFPYTFNILYKRNVLRGTRSNKIQHNVGFHSYIKKPYMLNDNKRTIKCIIPKGSRYLKNPKTGEYISNMIIPIKVVANKYNDN